MSASASEQKTSLRKSLLAERKRIDPSRLKKRSAELCAALLRHPKYLSATHIFAYLSGPGEVDLDALYRACIHDQKALYLPIITGRGQMEAGRVKLKTAPQHLSPAHPKTSSEQLILEHYPGLSLMEDMDLSKRIPEPRNASILAAEQLDLIIVPGLAYNAQKMRLGYGGGFYDRYLKRALSLDPNSGAHKKARSDGKLSEEKPYTLHLNFSDFERAFPIEDHDIPVDEILSLRI